MLFDGEHHELTACRRVHDVKREPPAFLRDATNGFLL
jgi:hypothetical protein